MKTKEAYITDLCYFKEKFVSEYGIPSAGFSGSVVRGEQHAGSGSDVFSELEEAAPLRMFDMREAPESLYGCNVDLLCSRKVLRYLLFKRIEQDGICA